MNDLIGFKVLKPIKPSFGHFHEAYELESGLIIARQGACYRMYTKEGYPLTGYAHTIETDTYGIITCSLGASKTEYELSDKLDEYNSIKNLINSTIDEKLIKLGLKSDK